MMLAGWGRYPHAECRVVAPRSREELLAAIGNEPSLIARGNGRAYGDAALNADATLDLRHRDRFVGFDDATGVLEAEAGTLLADMLDALVPRGWFPAVTPGTKFVTLGGMLAADVHGKNHHKAGAIGDHVESLRLAVADGSVRRCARDENPALFAATLGGMGLTGVILSARVKLRPIETAYIRQETLRARDLDEIMALFEASRDWTYTVAWIDCLARGRDLGRALLYRGEHARREELPDDRRAEPLRVPPRRPHRVPIDFPALTLNRWSVTAFNRLYYGRARPGAAIVDYDRFFYPLDAILDWNRLYGRSGFVQYQCVLPKSASRAGLAALLERVAAAGAGSFLSVLKLLGPGRGMLSFPMEGYTLALDFPADPANLVLMTELDAIVAAHGGRIYLAKDARVAAADFRRGYDDLAAFGAVRAAVDPGGKFASLQSRRLGL
ncbi:MAG: FAD-binding oxidoreductase [Alphaproteobacteria bacterium]|nr:FAD-binding oxidoreductase [Alphaproteobacteria bacterium]